MSESNRRTNVNTVEPTTELVTFATRPDASVDGLLAAARAANAWLERQPGYLSRTLTALGEGRYADHVGWRSLADAQAAAAQMMQAAETQDFIALIDPASVEMRHGSVILRHDQS